LAFNPDFVAIAAGVTVLPTLVVHESIVAVRAPLNFLGACPLISPFATSMPDVVGTCWAKRTDISILRILFLNINE
jgi:hypothetical protein